jgi:hypothetical protein
MAAHLQGGHCLRYILILVEARIGECCDGRSQFISDAFYRLNFLEKLLLRFTFL